MGHMFPDQFHSNLWFFRYVNRDAAAVQEGQQEGLSPLAGRARDQPHVGESTPLGERMGRDCGEQLEKLGALNLTSTWMILQ